MIAGHETEAAQGFFDYLHGRSAQSIFGNYGFILN